MQTVRVENNSNVRGSIFKACADEVEFHIGRRLAMMVSCVFGGPLVAAYIKPRNDVLIATTFFEQFFVGGVWGSIPVHLVELSPPALRVGVHTGSRVEFDPKLYVVIVSDMC